MCLHEIIAVSLGMLSDKTAWTTIKLGQYPKTKHVNLKTEMQKHIQFFAERCRLKTFAYVETSPRA
jgi:hypothetical protein